MMQNVKPFSETIGSVKDTPRLFSGQKDTFMYSDMAQKDGVNVARPKSKEIGQRWDENPAQKIEWSEM